MARIICKSSESLDDDQKSTDDANRKQDVNKLVAGDTIDEEVLLMEIKINDHGDEAKTTTGEGEIRSYKSDGNSLENSNGNDDDVVILRNKSNR